MYLYRLHTQFIFITHKTCEFIIEGGECVIQFFYIRGGESLLIMEEGTLLGRVLCTVRLQHDGQNMFTFSFLGGMTTDEDDSLQILDDSLFIPAG